MHITRLPSKKHKARLSLGTVGILTVLAAAALVYAEPGEATSTGGGTETPAVLKKMEETADKVGKKLEQGVNKVGDKLEEKHVGKKIEQKADKAVKKTGEGLEKAEKKVDEKLKK